LDSAAARFNERVASDPRVKESRTKIPQNLDIAYRIQSLVGDEAMVRRFGGMDDLTLVRGLTLEERILFVKKCCKVYIEAEGSVRSN